MVNKFDSDGFEITVRELAAKLGKGSVKVQLELEADRADSAVELLDWLPDLPATFFNSDNGGSGHFTRRFLIRARTCSPKAGKTNPAAQTVAVAACGLNSCASTARLWGPSFDASVANSSDVLVGSWMLSKISEELKREAAQTEKGKGSVTHLLAVIDKSATVSHDFYVALVEQNAEAAMHDVLHLVCILDDQKNRAKVTASGLILTPVDDESFERFLELLAATYEDSDDYPGVGENYSMAEVRSRWEQTRWERMPTADRTSGWFIVSTALMDGPKTDDVTERDCIERDVGCLVLNWSFESKNAELVYVGLAPEHRGNGWGRELILHARERVWQAGKETMSVSVDARNAKALSCYDFGGFTCYAESTIFVWPLKQSNTSASANNGENE